MKEFYNELKDIFKEYTTHNWKNGWEHEGDRESKKLTIQKEVKDNNLFLLQYNIGSGYKTIVEGPDGFKIEVHLDGRSNELRRIDIEYGLRFLDIFYYVDDENWLSTKQFLLDICQDVYDSNIKLRNTISKVPNNLYGQTNPPFMIQYHRDYQLKKVLDENI